MADDKPVVFANHVFSEFVEHLLGDDVEIQPKDYTTLRVVFRKLGGSWEGIVAGDPEQTKILIGVVKAWGKRRA